MKKFCIFLLMLAMFQVETQAQARQNKKKQYEKQWICVGVKGGVNISQMMYWRNPALNQLPEDTMFFPTGGVFADIPLNNYFSVAPEVMYVRRGTGLKYKHLPTGCNVHYTMKVHYVDLRIPVEFRWPITPWIQPYLTVGAEGGVRLGGKILMQRSAPYLLNDSIGVGSANMALFYGGVYTGLGIRSKVEIGGRDLLLKLAATYHQGLTNTYSAMEKQGTATASNVNVYNVTGSRLPQGLELTLGVAVSLKSLGKDACATFSHDRNRRRGHGRSSGF